MKYSKEFKDSTVQLILNNNESVVKVAENLDLNPQTLYNWVSAYRKSIIFKPQITKSIINQRHYMKKINA